VKPYLALATALACLTGCQRNLPPLVKGATVTGGGQGYDCEMGATPASDPRFNFSPEIIERLRKQFPPGSSSAALRSALVLQGFKLHGPCSPDHSISFAQFRLNKNEVVANVFWREQSDGQIIWTFGDVGYTFL
jgi:hypothetical protein